MRLALIVLACLCVSRAWAQTDCKAYTESEVMRLKEQPIADDSPPSPITDVNIGIKIRNVLMKGNNLAIISGYLTESWTDRRLLVSLPDECIPLNLHNDGYALVDRIWQPQLVDHHEFVSGTVHPDGTVKVGYEEESVRFEVDLDARQVPYDAQLTSQSGLNLRSYSMNTIGDASYQAVSIKLHFSEGVLWYITRLGFPCVFALLMAFASVFPGTRMMTARWMLVIFSYFVLFSTLIYSFTITPAISVFKASDIWFSGCFVCITLILVEQLFVSCYVRAADLPQLDITKESAEMRAARIARRLDGIFAVFILVVMLIFVGLFGTYYLFDITFANIL